MQKLKTATYIRLSKEDENKMGNADSESVQNQRKMLNEYISRNNELEFYKEYVDDGFSGTTAQSRPEFIKMIEEAKLGNIQCIVVKSFSRFSRNMQDASYYMYSLFEELDIRFISLNDNYDSNNGRYSTASAFFNVINEDYSRSLSANVRNTLKRKKMDGEFIGAFACYGYKKDPDNHNHLIIDDEAAEVVKRIYSLFLQGIGQKTIAKMLNSDNILCPSEYKKQCGLNYNNSNKIKSTTFWTYSTVHNILKNKMYYGAMWQNRNRTGKFIKGRRTYYDDEQIIVENTHEPIISKEEFEFVAEKLSKNRDITPQLNKNVSIYAGHLRCECGQPLKKKNHAYKGKKRIDYVCRAYDNSKSTCTSHYISQELLDNEILSFLNDCIKKVKFKNKIIQKEAKNKNKTANEIHKNIKAKQNEIETITKREKRVLDAYLDTTIDKSTFLAKKQELSEQKQFLEIKINELSQEIGKTEEEIFLSDPMIQALLTVGRFEALNKEIIDTFIDTIIIHEDETKEKTLEIIPTFSEI